MKKYVFTLICLLGGFNLNLLAQDFTFSQFYEQPILRNPALAGVFTGDLRISTAYRDQWSSITVPFRTTSLSIEYKIPVNEKNDYLTLSTQMSVDAAGDISLKRTQFKPALNFHKSLSGNRDTYLSGAFMFGIVSSHFDASKLILGDQYRNSAYNPSNPSSQPIVNTGFSYWDLSSGLCFSTNINTRTNFYIATGMTHVTNPVIKSTTGSVPDAVPPKYSINTGLHTQFGYKNHLKAFADYFAQGGNRQFLGGLLYGVNIAEYNNAEPDIFYIGSFLRWGDAIIPAVNIGLSHFNIGVSYDINISKLNVASNWRGGLEVSLSYIDFLKIRNTSIDKVRCTRF
jgi:type IX secretion system PorP/SprF family membrane protein